MTNEELLDKIMYSQVPTVTILERGEYRAELLRRLGAAVSAHPQPKVDEFLATIGFDVSKGDGLGLEWEPRFIATKAFQFFAAAPAQEPRPAPMEREALAVELFRRHRMRHNGRTRNQANLLSTWELLGAYQRMVWLDTAADVQNILATPPREGPPFCTAEHPDDFIFCHRPEGHAGNHKNNHINSEWVDTPQETPEPSTQKYFCSNCVQYLNELEAMDTHDQSHDIVRVYRAER